MSRALGTDVTGEHPEVRVAGDPSLARHWFDLVAIIGGSLDIANLDPATFRGEHSLSWRGSTAHFESPGGAPVPEIPSSIDARPDPEEAARVAILGLSRGEVTITNEGWVARRFPRFWRVFDEAIASSGR